MKIIKRINNKNYNIIVSPIPAHKKREVIPPTPPPIPIMPPITQTIKQPDSRINLLDVTFMIPVKIESNDRKRCLTVILDYIQKYFNTYIIVCEEGSSSLFPTLYKPEWGNTVRYIFRQTNSELFHKTLNLNIMAKESTTPILAAYDSDVIFRPFQYQMAAESIRKNIVDFCYPFNQPNYNIPKPLFNTFQASLDLSSVENEINFKHPLPPPGGCLFLNKEKFIKAGMENQNFVSWGPEDMERRERLVKLGYKLSAINGKLFHLDHDRTVNSHDGNEYFSKNEAEYNKIADMTREQLEQYVATWDWTK